jgi:hypothetical protein
MAQTTGEIRGRLIGLYISSDDGTTYELAALGTSKNIDITISEIDITNDSSAGNEEILPDLVGGTFSVDGITRYEALTNNILGYEILDLALAKGKLKVKWTTDATGDRRIVADAYCLGYSESAPTTDKGTYSANFKITGGITSEVIS